MWRDGAYVVGYIAYILVGSAHLQYILDITIGVMFYIAPDCALRRDSSSG